MDLRGKVLTAALIWTGNTFEKAIQIRVDSDGTITGIGKQILKQGEQFIDLGLKALLPGFVNAHSHAFHRHMRGRSRIGSATSDSFWKWRDDMYAIVENIDRQQLYEYALATFKEMLSAGITTVGEFHYVHHGNNKFELDSAILDAAQRAQIRIVLINTLYCRAGFGSEQLANAQKRFVSTMDDFINSVNQLDKIKGSQQTVAVSAHSLRAVPLEDCVRLSEWAKKNSKPLHIHVEEQPKEIEDCRATLHSTPSQLILNNIDADVRLTAVHCTFTPAETMDAFATRAINVCVCPLTEGYLGDGMPNITDNSYICLGTDCNNRICMLEEMRWLAYCQHMKRNSRRVCGLNAQKLLRIATENGARSLGLEGNVGRFEIGMQLDFVAFDLTSHRIASAPADELLDAIVFGAGNADIAATAVSGRIVSSR
ncbi:5-methylthioadenosine/S-adenosylhomocysteine deaminase [Toxocara canis]|uniref:5-methylthioadenosine/S-adenosylhomocysteine deaminase n=1 Tax=Toxocara canis TaxID=6265 RepID=A0A0B2VYF5_TOXCA|nr:5-methylthioadenosine/S-adenosylhomocysteine deaminase [Toxocara canis]